MKKEQNKWLSVPEYAKLIGKTRAQIYLDIRTGKINKSEVRKAKIVKERLEIKA